MKGIIFKKHDFLENQWYNGLVDDEDNNETFFELEECDEQPNDWKLKDQPLYVPKKDVKIIDI